VLGFLFDYLKGVNWCWNKDCFENIYVLQIVLFLSFYLKLLTTVFHRLPSVRIIRQCRILLSKPYVDSCQLHVLRLIGTRSLATRLAKRCRMHKMNIAWPDHFSVFAFKKHIAKVFRTVKLPSQMGCCHLNHCN
jgi:hypothetical protein